MDVKEKQQLLISSLFHDLGKAIMRFEKDKAIHEKVGAEFLKSLNNPFFTPLVIKGIIEHHGREHYNINYDQEKADRFIKLIKSADSLDSTQRREEKDKKQKLDPQDIFLIVLSPMKRNR
ncbi:MAG: HD domain-containing protein [Candidatus Diapherotrites archaeon]